MRTSHPQEPRSSVDVLDEMLAALDQAGRVAADVSEAVSLLDALLEEGGAATLADSPSLAEIEAIAQRIGRLSAVPSAIDWQLQETVEQAAEVLRLLRLGAQRARLASDPGTALDFVLATLAGIPERDVERLVGAPHGQLDTWSSHGVPSRDAERLATAALVLLDLGGALTATQMVQWFSDERAQLDGASPLTRLDAGAAGTRDQLRRLARTPHAVTA
jgi:hypothetical protein